MGAKRRKYGAYIIDNNWLTIIYNMRKFPLHESGFKVIGYTTNPEKAICDIAALKPEVVICELDLSDMDGITLMQKIKNAGIDCSFILFADTRTLALMRRFFHSGGCDYWQKPMDRREWLEAYDTLKTVYDKLEQKGTTVKSRVSST